MEKPLFSDNFGGTWIYGFAIKRPHTIKNLKCIGIQTVL